MSKTPTVVIYHSPCADGLAAAWVIRKCAPDAKFVPQGHGDMVITVESLANEHVVIVDYAYPREVLESINAVAASLLVLDHHKTNQRTLEDLPWCVFDMDRAGCQLAWNHYMADNPRPWFINYIAAQDLYKHDQMPFSREINSVLHGNGHLRSFESLDALAAMDPAATYEEMRIEGIHALGFRQRQIDAFARGGVRCTLGKLKLMAVYNTPHNYISAVGHKLYNENEIDFVVFLRFSHETNEWWCSFRSNKNFDCTKNVLINDQSPRGHPGACGLSLSGDTNPREIFIMDQ